MELIATPVTKPVFYSEKNFHSIPQLARFDQKTIRSMRAVAAVLPFRVNQYVLNHLIDWSNVPSDPIFQMTFPQPQMLAEVELAPIYDALARNEDVTAMVQSLRAKLNPHPGEQLSLNVPVHHGVRLQGIQHKYQDTMLFFPAQGQTCHSYCTFCFRWAQFVGDSTQRFASKEADDLFYYASAHPELSDVIFTGGDPLIMKTRILAQYIEPLLAPELEHVQNIRLGTKSLAYWPQRFVTDEDANDLLRLIEKLAERGKHVAIMAHYNHWVELEPEVAKHAIKNLQNAGAVIRCQGPLLAHVNDHAHIWERLWRTQVQLGLVPYYMFIERDTGPRDYFAKTLIEALTIYNTAMQPLSGLTQTVRGPVMSASNGKVKIDGVLEFNQTQHLALKYIRARNPAHTNQVFLAKLDEKATWFNDLQPAYPEHADYFSS